MNFDVFIKKMALLLSKDLPGISAHKAMESEVRRRMLANWDKNNIKESAVLVMLYKGRNNKVMTVLTLKQNGIGIHSGQISLPGGKFEPEDITFEKTALRETEEEIGIPASDIEIIGKLTSLAIPRSGFMVHPFVGVYRNKPCFLIQKNEVAELYEVILQNLLKHSNKDSFTMADENGDTFEVPSYQLAGRHLWGATAMIMSEIEHLLRQGELLNE